MIKKIIFSSAIILSLITHHAVCMNYEDDEFDTPTISVRLADLDEQRRKEVQRNVELILREPGCNIDGPETIEMGAALEASYERLFKINTQRQKLILLLEKLGTLPAPAA